MFERLIFESEFLLYDLMEVFLLFWNVFCYAVSSTLYTCLDKERYRTLQKQKAQQESQTVRKDKIMSTILLNSLRNIISDLRYGNQDLRVQVSKILDKIPTQKEVHWIQWRLCPGSLIAASSTIEAFWRSFALLYPIWISQGLARCWSWLPSENHWTDGRLPGQAFF